MLKAVIFLGFVVCARAMVCLPDACQTVRCAALTAENCQGSIKTGGGYCGCCDACITELALNDKCMPIMFLGMPQTTTCAPGLYCDKLTSTCQDASRLIIRDASSGACATKLAEVEARLAASQHTLLGLEKPHCNMTTGEYVGMQFSGSQAYCVTKDGTAISGYMVNRWETGDDMNCKCARDQYDYMQTGLIGKMFYCEANGNYPNTA